MSKRILKFPEGFLWGVASASHQTEGNNNNNDFWAWEQTPGHIIDNTTSALACNWWQMAEEDFERAAQLGVNTLRLSVEWSRLQPEEHRWDESAFERYRAMLLKLKELHIKPMITLHHFTNPLWVVEQGGWNNEKIADNFVRYSCEVVRKLGDLCQLWCTINEPSVYASHAFLFGKWPPGAKSFRKVIHVTRNQVKAHAGAYRAMHELQPEAHIGLAKHIAIFAPAYSAKVPDKVSCWLRDKIFNWRFIDAITKGRLRYPFALGGSKFSEAKNTNDFIGINYYGRHLLKFSIKRGEFGARPVDADAELAWSAPWTDREMYPEGIYQTLRKLTGYKRPLYITENGIADEQDNIRPGFILRHLTAVHRAIQEGAPVKGFYHWTLIDNYEWVEGWTTRFGLIGMDPETQERIIRPSAHLYSEIAKNNGITEGIVAKYAPDLMDEIFDSAKGEIGEK